MEYLNFDLEIGTGNGLEYPVSLHSPAGEAREVMRFPYSRDQLNARLKDLTIALLQSASISRQVLPTEMQSVQNMGKDFFNALFTGEIRSRYDLSQRIAQEQGKGLRIRLSIQSGELSALPWEYLYDPRSFEYLGLSTSTPLIRYLEVPQAIRAITVNTPLQILGMVCSPSNLQSLDVNEEKHRVEEALASLKQRGLVDLTWIQGETWVDLQDALLDGTWHIFHFIGHGDFDEARDEGYLLLSGPDGKSRKLYATEFARLLADHKELRLVVLNACKGARSSWESIYSSVAAVLVRRGIACTVAMQFSITDAAAVELARRFYSLLARGLPVDTALTEARKSLSIGFLNSVEWGTPVLFMRSPDGKLFQPQESTNSTPAPTSEKASGSLETKRDVPDNRIYENCLRDQLSSHIDLIHPLDWSTIKYELEGAVVPQQPDHQNDYQVEQESNTPSNHPKLYVSRLWPSMWIMGKEITLSNIEAHIMHSLVDHDGIMNWEALCFDVWNAPMNKTIIDLRLGRIRDKIDNVVGIKNTGLTNYLVRKLGMIMLLNYEVCETKPSNDAFHE